MEKKEKERKKERKKKPLDGPQMLYEFTRPIIKVDKP